MRDGKINEGIKGVVVAAACVEFKGLSSTITLNIESMWGQDMAGLL